MADYPAIFRSPKVPDVARSLTARLRRDLDALDDASALDLLADTVYRERLRFEEDGADERELRDIDAGARAIAKGERRSVDEAILGLVRSYAEEIHNPFSTRAYGLATRVLPRALTNLVTATDPRRLLTGDIDPARRIVVGGEVDRVVELSKRATIILAPTHLSNLDSPLIGYVLHLVGLPPFAYGAGLNLFSNPMMAFWMSRLGAYTVDRRKQGRLYKDVLKAYSTEVLSRGFHSLFFPGGTRSRSGRVEASLKKGLLGTGLKAWQENLSRGVDRPDVFVVPLNLSTSLVLEAETLIRDSLAREGKQRYIIVDDEFSRPRTVASYLSRVANLDEAIHVVFGQPLDCMGNPVNDDGVSIGPNGATIDRARYVSAADGSIQWDPQRDRVYTARLARSIVRSFFRDNVALSTHVAAFCGWEELRSHHPHLDTWRLVRVDPSHRLLARGAVLARIERVMAALRRMASQDRIRVSLPHSAERVLDTAVARFGSFHTRPALRHSGGALLVDPELLLFYRNRLVGYDLETA